LEAWLSCPWVGRGEQIQALRPQHRLTDFREFPIFGIISPAGFNAPSGKISMSYVRTSFLGLAIFVLSAPLVSSAEVRAQGMQPNMKQMPGMGDAKQGTTASATGTVTAVNTADRKIFNHGPTMPSA
jgi:hypothetical protein